MRIIYYLTLLFFPLIGTAQDWEPYHELGDFYPSFAIATAHLVVDPDEKPDPLLKGDPNGILGISFVPSKANTRVRLDLRCASSLRLFEPTSMDVTLPRAGATYIITPTVPYDQTKLASLRQSETAYITYTVTINGQKQPPRTERLRVRSINDCPFAVSDEHEGEASIDWMFAAYVNEDHPHIQKLLQEALAKKYVDAFAGYQGSKNEVYRQVLAIWRVLQDRGLRYSSITTVAPETEAVASQHVRLLDESMRYQQANCVDGSVLFASVLRKIGINPILVVVPGHLFVGFDLDEAGQQQAYLETTLLGSQPTESTGTSALYKALAGSETTAKGRAAVGSFVNAIREGNQEFAVSKAKIEREKAGYAVVNVGEARQIGIMPINYVADAR